ncbi:hypothetical protein FQR65_LT09776 [Abscondita terminalis]|nr:hypothetical protein FQR65_LT09776 [Abscondita terminalis]
MKRLSEERTKVLFQKLSQYIGSNVKHLIERPDGLYCFREQKDRVYYVAEKVLKFGESIPPDQLVSVGTCFGKFTKTNKFRLHITALNYLAPYAQNKVWVKPSMEQQFLYGHNVTKAGLGRISEATEKFQGVLVYSMSDLPLGFGVAARTTLECKHADPLAVVCFHQADIDSVMWNRTLFFLHVFLLLELIPTNSARSAISNRRYCGFQHSDDYDHPGTGISIDEFPWMAQLLYNNETRAKCSGSLINNLYVLSAALCLTNKNSKITLVRLGDYNVKTYQDCTKIYKGELECSDLVVDVGVEKIIVHPLYNSTVYQHDIALIRLKHSITFSDYIRPICLPERNLLQSNNIRNLTSSGWGKLGLNSEQTEIKKRVFTKLVSIDECKKAYLIHHINITEDQICGREYDSITCAGDSGGPLMNSINNQWEQVGLISFSTGCGQEHVTVYANVFNYLDWILSTMRP